MGIAFFDLDRTLIRRNSATMWVKSELRAGRVSLLEAARAGTWMLRYALGFSDLEVGVRAAISSLRGSREDELSERIDSFYEREVRPLYRPGARPALARHRAEGHRLVLLTSASDYISRHVVRDLELDDYLANRFEVDERGVFTGRSNGELCYGEGKLVLARAHAQAHGAALADCAFYTDSMADLPVLEVVGRPVVVDPDPRLRRLAAKRGWPIEDWDRV